jgi:GT2 family glycosyltransferase
VEQVHSLPFVGFFINRALVNRIGLPSSELFIYWDDLEYALRAKQDGSRVFLVKSSRILHPLPVRRVFRFLGKEVIYRDLPPWKIYYDVRNKILVTQQYRSKAVLLKTFAGIALRAFWDVVRNPEMLRSLLGYGLGIWDGLFKRTGMRVPPS